MMVSQQISLFILLSDIKIKQAVIHARDLNRSPKISDLRKKVEVRLGLWSVSQYFLGQFLDRPLAKPTSRLSCTSKYIHRPILQCAFLSLLSDREYLECREQCINMMIMTNIWTNFWTPKHFGQFLDSILDQHWTSDWTQFGKCPNLTTLFTPSDAFFMWCYNFSL